MSSCSLASRNRRAAFSALRGEIHAIECGALRTERLSLDVPEIDAALGGGLPRTGLHELRGSAAVDFALSLSRRCVSLSGTRRIFWFSSECAASMLYPNALLARGIAPESVVAVEVRGDAELIWAAHTCMDEVKASVVILMLSRPMRFADARRLQVAAQSHAGVGFVLSRFDHSWTNGVAWAPLSRENSPAPDRANSPALVPGAFSRWRVDPIVPLGHRSQPGVPEANEECRKRWGLERQAWALMLVKNRFGKIGTWQVIHDDETYRFSLFPHAVHRSGGPADARHTQSAVRTAGA